MVSNTPKGRETRKYFIKIEKEHNKPMSSMEMVIASATAVLEMEKKQAEQDKRLEKVEHEVRAKQTAIDFFTVIGYYAYKRLGKLSLKDAGRLGKKVTRYCKDNSIKMGNTPDARYGRVNTYPLDVLEEVLNV